RSVEPRLSIDVPYAAFRLMSADQLLTALKTKYPRLFNAALTASPRQKGLIDLLLGQRDTAIKSLANPIDLSPAHYMQGLQSGSLNDFARALQALSGVPESPSAHFNRALILEQLADRDAAAAEWKRYLAFDPSSEWTDEAQQHLAADSQPST